MSRHRVENGDCTGVSLAGDCLTGCPDQDGVVDARQPTHGGAELVARSGHPGRVSSALGYRHGLVWVDVRPAAILARAVQQHDSGGAGVGECPHVLAGCTDHEAVLVAEVEVRSGEERDGGAEPITGLGRSARRPDLGVHQLARARRRPRPPGVQYQRPCGSSRPRRARRSPP